MEGWLFFPYCTYGFFHCTYGFSLRAVKKYLASTSMVVEMVPLKGGIGSIWGPPEGKDYKWYISGIYCQLGD